MNHHISQLSHENYKLKLKYAELCDKYKKLEDIIESKGESETTDTVLSDLSYRNLMMQSANHPKCICEKYRKILNFLQCKISELNRRIIEQNKMSVKK